MSIKKPSNEIKNPIPKDSKAQMSGEFIADISQNQNKEIIQVCIDDELSELNQADSPEIKPQFLTLQELQNIIQPNNPISTIEFVENLTNRLGNIFFEIKFFLETLETAKYIKKNVAKESQNECIAFMKNPNFNPMDFSEANFLPHEQREKLSLLTDEATSIESMRIRHLHLETFLNKIVQKGIPNKKIDITSLLQITDIEISKIKSELHPTYYLRTYIENQKLINNLFQTVNTILKDLTERDPETSNWKIFHISNQNLSEKIKQWLLANYETPNEDTSPNNIALQLFAYYTNNDTSDGSGLMIRAKNIKQIVNAKFNNPSRLSTLRQIPKTKKPIHKTHTPTPIKDIPPATTQPQTTSIQQEPIPNFFTKTNTYLSLLENQNTQDPGTTVEIVTKLNILKTLFPSHLSGKITNQEYNQIQIRIENLLKKLT